MPPELTLKDGEFEELRELILRQTGVQLSDGKRPLLVSRLAKRLRLHGCQSFGDYHRHLREKDPDGSELREMIGAVTTHKTSFYREPHHFELLARLLGSTASRGRPLRLWSAACSSGEEPYTMAIAVREALAAGRLPASSDVRILATDIDVGVLERAEQGTYPLERKADLPAGVLQRHFLRGQGTRAAQMRVRAPLRELIAFRRLNLIEAGWPMRGPFDAIFCRNVLIYFDKQTQQAVVSRLVDKLRPGGLLALGHSESMLGARPDLRSLGHSAFEKCAVAA